VAEDSAAGILGKVVLGGAVGFALVFVAMGLGGSGRGQGRGIGRGEGSGAGEPSVPSVPPPISPPPLPKDDKRLVFVMIEPRAAGGSMGFRLRGGVPSRVYALKELIDRVRGGGRTDVDLVASGAVPQGAWNEALALIQRSGLTVGLSESLPSLPVHAGRSWYEDRRGQYQRGSW
jgi:hypothetical protein